MSYTGFFADRGPLRGGQGRQRREGLLGRPDDPRGGHRRQGLRDDHRPGDGRDPTGHPPRGHRSSSGWPAGSGSSRRPTTPPRCSPGSWCPRRWRSCSTRTARRTTAAEILELTICEPALGSGAFAIEAVRQLAAEYLARRQRELDETIDPDDYPRELQKVKAYLALHQVYGVDLNATAVELAEISLWLDTMVEGLEAPWFGLHLRRGNSLIGARKAVFTREQVADKSWLKAVPKPVVPGSNNPDEAPSFSGRIPHFLLPADGWGAAADVGKDIKDLVPEAVASLKTWRRSMWAKPTKKQVDALAAMTKRVETLWDFATRRLAIADSQIRRDIDVWGVHDG